MAFEQKPGNQLIGLWTANNPVNAPAGAFSVLDNCVIEDRGVIQNRRGFNSYGNVNDMPATNEFAGFANHMSSLIAFFGEKNNFTVYGDTIVDDFTSQDYLPGRFDGDGTGFSTPTNDITATGWGKMINSSVSSDDITGEGITDSSGNNNRIPTALKVDSVSTQISDTRGNQWLLGRITSSLAPSGGWRYHRAFVPRIFGLEHAGDDIDLQPTLTSQDKTQSYVENKANDESIAQHGAFNRIYGLYRFDDETTKEVTSGNFSATSLNAPMYVGNNRIYTAAWRVLCEVETDDRKYVGPASAKYIYRSPLLNEVVDNGGNREVTYDTGSTISIPIIAHGQAAGDFFIIVDTTAGTGTTEAQAADWIGVYEITSVTDDEITITVPTDKQDDIINTTVTIDEYKIPKCVRLQAWLEHPHTGYTNNEWQNLWEGQTNDITAQRRYFLYRTEAAQSLVIPEEERDLSGFGTLVPYTVDPGEEMFLADSNGTAGIRQPGVGDLSSSFNLPIFDATLGTELGATLYVSPSQEGSLQNNDAVGAAYAMATFRDHTFYGNVDIPPQGFQKLVDTDISTGDTFQLLAGAVTENTIVAQNPGDSDPTTGSEVAFTAIDTDDTASIDGAIYSYDQGSCTELTIRNIARAVNSTPEIECMADVVYTASRPSGEIIFRRLEDACDETEAPDLTGSNFEELSTSYTSRLHNRLYYSKVQETLAVPRGQNFIELSEEAEIVELVELSNRLLVFTTDGVYQVTGVSAPFTVRLVYPTLRCIAPDGVKKLRDKVFVPTDSGLYVVGNEQQDISTPINDVYNARSKFSNFFANTHAVTSELHDEYIIWMPKAETSTERDAFRYNDRTGTWTKLLIDAQASFTPSRDRFVYIGGVRERVVGGNAPLVQRERTFDEQTGDVSFEIDYEPGLSTGTTLRFADFNTTTDIFVPEVGDSIEIDGEKRIVTAVENLTGDDYDITIEEALDSPTGSTVVWTKGFQTNIQPMPWVGNSFGLMKQYNDFMFWIENANAQKFTVTYLTDRRGNITESEVTTTHTSATAQDLWGIGNWGEDEWGDQHTYTYATFRDFIPQRAQIGQALHTKIKHNRAGEFFRLLGMQVEHWDITEQVRK